MGKLGTVLLTTLLLVAVTRPARADEEGRRMRAAGIALVVVGSALTIAGSVFVSEAMGSQLDEGHPVSSFEAFESGGGWSFIAVGQAGIAIGLPLWIVGGKWQTRP
jgi:hypothetical protein